MTDQQNKVLHNDVATCRDLCEWESVQERLIARLMECATPHVMGIHGDWGSGKTSFMRQLQRRLGGEAQSGTVEADGPAAHQTYKKTVVTVWFDAWRYQNEASPVVALLQEIREQLKNSEVLKDAVKKMGHTVVGGLLDNLSQVGKLIGFESLPDLSKFEKRGEQWEQNNFAQELTTNRLHEHLQESIKRLLPEKNGRIIVFIDDLDRCHPAAAMRLLEGLKIYLNLNRCVFVLGMNEWVLTDAVREVFAGMKSAPDAEVKNRASQYMEKICSDIFRIPMPDQGACGRLFCKWVTELLTEGEGRAWLPPLRQVLQNCPCLPPNPRRLKAWANQWPQFIRCLAKNGRVIHENLVKAALICAYLHQFQREIWERWQYNPEFWEELKRWCSTEEGAESQPEWQKSLNRTMIVRQKSEGEGSTQDRAVERKPLSINPCDPALFWLDSLIFDAQELRNEDFTPMFRNIQ